MMMERESEKKMEREFEGPEEASASVFNSNAFIRPAEAYRLQGRYEEAIETCQKGLAKTPDSLAGRLLLGKCYLEKSMIAEAREELEKVAAGIEECFSVYKLLSQVYLHQQNVDKALETLKKSLYLPSLEEAPKKGAVPPEMSLFHQGPNLPLATPRVDLQATLSETVKTPEVGKPVPAAIQTDTLAEIYVKQGHLDRALSVYQEILSREPENNAVREKCEALKNRVEEEEKVASAKKALHHLEQWLAAVSSKDDSTRT
jgi:tetratricopeptide (TPR) repeat protein